MAYMPGVLRSKPSKHAVEEYADPDQGPIGSEIPTKQRSTDLKDQYTQGGQHRKDDEVGSRRTELPPPTSPRVDDKPKEEPRSVHDERENAEQVSNVIHHATRKRAGEPAFRSELYINDSLGCPTGVILSGFGDRTTA